MKLAFGLAAAMLLALAAPAAAAPRVVVTLKPLHSLVAAVMEGVAVPTLLLPNATSPHTYSLRPSDTRALADADLVLWVGPALETFLEKPLTAIAGRAEVIALADSANLMLLPLREAGANDEHAHDHDGDGRDMHFWLDVGNAARVVTFAATTLAQRDGANAARYHSNATRVLQELQVLDQELATLLRPAAKRPFLTLHDAFQYLEARYGLQGRGTLTVSPDRVPGAKGLATMRTVIADAQVTCVFGEPQFPKALGTALTQGTAARLVVVDSLGATLPPGPGAYATTVRGLAQAFAGCLAVNP
jgi:zinc transport system substrate-binding protein